MPSAASVLGKTLNAEVSAEMFGEAAESRTLELGARPGVQA